MPDTNRFFCAACMSMSQHEEYAISAAYPWNFWLNGAFH
jgi:hypothetical protein